MTPPENPYRSPDTPPRKRRRLPNALLSTLRLYLAGVVILICTESIRELTKAPYTDPRVFGPTILGCGFLLAGFVRTIREG